MHVLFEGDPITIDFDDEISMTTESLKNYLDEKPQSVKKRPPPVSVRIGSRRSTRSMSKTDLPAALPVRNVTPRVSRKTKKVVDKMDKIKVINFR